MGAKTHPVRQKAYNAREGIETNRAEPWHAQDQAQVRKHTMLERALRLRGTFSRTSISSFRQKAYNAREGIETLSTQQSCEAH